MGTPYNVGTGRTETIGEMIDIVLKIWGTNKPIEHDPVLDRGTQKFSNLSRTMTNSPPLQAGMQRLR